MGLTIGENFLSNTVNRWISANSNSANAQLKHVASGLRVLNISDDASAFLNAYEYDKLVDLGYFVENSVSTTIKTLALTQEGLKELQGTLQQLNTLATQAQTMPANIVSLDATFQGLVKSMDDLVSNLSFNGFDVLSITPTTVNGTAPTSPNIAVAPFVDPANMKPCAPSTATTPPTPGVPNGQYDTTTNFTKIDLNDKDKFGNGTRALLGTETSPTKGATFLNANRDTGDSAAVTIAINCIATSITTITTNQAVVGGVLTVLESIYDNILTGRSDHDELKDLALNLDMPDAMNSLNQTMNLIQSNFSVMHQVMDLNDSILALFRQ